MKKCILFSRVSTLVQVTTQQTTELYNEAGKNGYSNDEIIVIESKESAIKLDSSERKSIQELYDTIEKNQGIECIIVREISRLARRADVLFEVRNHLIEKGIQLICCKPYLRLLDEDGKMTQSANIMFSLFSAISESEMQIKKERFAEGRARKKKDKKYIGGKVLFGYKISPEKDFVIDEVNANVVRRIFDMFCSGKYAARQIGKQLHDEGILKQNEIRSAENFIFKLLKNKSYLGTEIYKPIISKYKFDKAQKLLKANKIMPHQTYDGNIYFAHRLMYTTGDKSRQFVVRKTDAAYIEPVTRFAISVNWIDSLLLYCAQFAYIAFGQKDIDRLTKKYRDDIKSIENRLNQYDIDETKIKESIDKLEERYILGKISLDKLESLRKKIEDELKKVSTSRQKDLALVSNYRDNLNAIRTNSDKKIDVYEMTPEEQQNFIWKEIEKVYTGRIKNGTYQVSVIYKNPLIKSETYTIFTKRHKIEKDGKEFDLKIVKRYNRKGLEI